MKILAISGSPRKNGKTAEVINMLKDRLQSKGHEMDSLFLDDFSVKGCRACNGCFTDKKKPYCVQKDDAQILFNRIEKADAVIYASPIYAFSFPAQIKAFLDRHYCLVTNPGLPSQSSVFEGKKVLMLATCCDPVENNAELVPVIFDRLFKRLKCTVAGKYIVESSYAPDFGYRAEITASAIATAILD